MKTFFLLLTILTRGQREHGLYKGLYKHGLYKGLYKKLYKEEGETGNSTPAQSHSWSLLTHIFVWECNLCH